MTHNAKFEGDLMLFTFLADGETSMQHWNNWTENFDNLNVLFFATNHVSHGFISKQWEIVIEHYRLFMIQLLLIV